jgi:hypothetical protein
MHDAMRVSRELLVLDRVPFGYFRATSTAHSARDFAATGAVAASKAHTLITAIENPPTVRVAFTLRRTPRC